MRLVAFKTSDGPRVGAVVDKGVIDLTGADPSAPRTIEAAIHENRLDEFAVIAAKASQDKLLDYDDLDFDLPIANPGKVLCLGLNYMDHVAEGPFSKQDFPAI